MKPTLLTICLLGVFSCFAQPEKPAVFLSQREMTANGGQPYDEYYWLNSNLASLTSTNVSFPITGSYRFDLSAYGVKGTSQLSVLIDGTSKGAVSVESSSTKIYSLFINEITSGTHTITLQLSNFGVAANHCRVGLLYFTQTSSATPYVFPAVNITSLPPSNQYLTGDHFRSKQLRGFNLSKVYTLSELKAKNIPAARQTGANIGRYWISVSHLPGSTDYYFCSTPSTNIGNTSLETLDSAVRIAEKVGMYLVITLEVHPDQAECDLWGTSAEAVGRRNGLKAVWQQIATRYKDKTIVAGYDLINEPRLNFNVAEYLRWQAEMVEAIRAIDPNHVIAIECLKNQMYGMMLPLPYPNLIYSPHGYSPLKITHQGIGAYQGSTDPAERQMYPGNSPYEADYFPNVSYWRAPMDFGKTYNAPIWVGEFSCVNWAPKNAAGEWVSTRWLDDCIKFMESVGWSWSYHAWREFQAWDSEIPSSYYDSYTFTNGAPFTRSAKPSDWSSARTSTAPTITMLRKWFGLNASIQTTSNIPPSVTITSPETNSAYDTTQFIVVNVDASDSDGNIAKVELYNHDTLLLSKSAAPYSFIINDLVKGAYRLMVKAYDNNGGTATSSEVDITVSDIEFTILPMQLEFFKVATVAPGEAEFKWRTTVEINTSHFEIEYYNQQISSWSTLGEVVASGNTAIERDYSFIGHLETGSYQVRLKQVLKDGNFSYSAIRSLNMNSSSSLFSLYVHSRKLIIRSSMSTNYHVKVFDLNGRAIASSSLSSNTGEINLPNVIPGFYILLVNSEDGQRQAQKILIN
jgi:endoglucanase